MTKKPTVLTLILENEVHPWRGAATDMRCAITGRSSFFFDRYSNDAGQDVAISLNASKKIQNLVRRRDQHGAKADMDFLVYDREVRIVDRRKPKESNPHVVDAVDDISEAR